MDDAPIVLSFDVEEHYRVEAASHLSFTDDRRQSDGESMVAATRRLLDLLAKHGARATFFIVGEIARDHPELVRDIHESGHEVASHGHRHARIHRLNPETFGADLRESRDALEQAAGAPVAGFRAPTFSVTRETAWAIDVLAEQGFAYDSSIFPVKHDRYGIADAPRAPFWVVGRSGRVLELPPTTWRILGFNLPVAGGGYFRLFPLAFMERGIRQARRLSAGAAMLYFHPWEFDPDHPRLPLSPLSRFRTYVGVKNAFARLDRLLGRHRFSRAIDVARMARVQPLPEFRVGSEANHVHPVHVGQPDPCCPDRFDHPRRRPGAGAVLSQLPGGNRETPPR
jgi:polysaccharide deacetylase family protein (PEP-CTERM system associated)